MVQVGRIRTQLLAIQHVCGDLRRYLDKNDLHWAIYAPSPHWSDSHSGIQTIKYPEPSSDNQSLPRYENHKLFAPILVLKMDIYNTWEGGMGGKQSTGSGARPLNLNVAYVLICLDFRKFTSLTLTAIMVHLKGPLWTPPEILYPEPRPEGLSWYIIFSLSDDLFPGREKKKNKTWHSRNLHLPVILTLPLWTIHGYVNRAKINI